MPIPYSNDLRKKVINLIKQGKKQTEIADLLSINKATIFRWNKKYKAEGNIDFKGYNKNQDKIKINSNKLIKMISSNPDLTSSELAFRIKGISNVTIWRSLNKFGFSYKKNSGYILNAIKKKELHSRKK